MENKNKRRVFFIIPIFVIVLCFFGSFTMSWMVVADVLRKENKDLASISAEKVFNEINSKLERSITVGQYIAADDYILNILEDENNMSRAEIESKLSSHLNKVTEKFGFTTISVVSNATGDYYTNHGFNKTIDVENDPHDVWYKIFLEKNTPYDFDIDVDEVTGNTWTVFLNTRLENDGKLLGTSGAAVTMSDMQRILIDFQNTYDIEITLVDQNGLVQVEVDDINIENAILENINYSADPSVYNYIESGKGYTVTRYMENLGWILVIFKDNGNSKVIFRELLKDNLLVMLLVLIFVSIILFYILRQSHGLVAESYIKQLSAASMIYHSLHVIYLKDNSFQELHIVSENAPTNLYKYKKDAIYAIKYGMKEIVRDDFMENMMEFVDLSTVADRLLDHRTITQEFISKKFGEWYKARFVVVNKDNDGKALTVLFGLENINEEKIKENKLRYLAEIDGLTGITNRATGELIISEYIKSGKEGMFCLLDVDKFKSVNDTYGHHVGDAIICAIADALKSSFRGDDVAMRFGGDEFAFYALGVVDKDSAKKSIMRFFDRINEINIPELTDYKIHVSLGAAFYTADRAVDFKTLYNKADEGTYISKKIDGNSYTICEW